jgi:membrane protein
MIIKGYRVETLAKRVLKEVLDDNVLGLAAALAYNAFFSLFPLLLFLSPMFSLIGDKREFVDFLLGQLQDALPPAALALVAGVVEDVVFSPTAPGLISIGALLALWAGSNVFDSLTSSLNRAYDLEEGRPWWKTRLIAIAMVIVSGAVLALATITFVGGDRIIDWVGRQLGLGETSRRIWTVAQFALALLTLVALAWLQFYVLPATRQRKRTVLVGAIVTTLLWVVVTLGFRTYVVNFGNYNATYGSIGGVIVLLTWLYLSMVVLLVGGEVNSELVKGTGKVEGRHEAVVLFGDRVATGETPRTSVERIQRLSPGRT